MGQGKSEGAKGSHLDMRRACSEAQRRQCDAFRCTTKDYLLSYQHPFVIVVFYDVKSEVVAQSHIWKRAMLTPTFSNAMRGNLFCPTPLAAYLKGVKSLYKWDN